MSTASKTTLKSYFETGDVPTQSNFVDLIDSLSGSAMNVFYVSKYNNTADYADLDTAYTALPSTGGVIILDTIIKGETGYTTPTTIAKDNVTIACAVPPIIDYDNEEFGNDCAFIEGEVAVTGDNSFFLNVGFFTGTAALENDCLVYSTASINHRNYNCAYIGYLRNSAFHCLLSENGEYLDIRNAQTLKNVWGVALKASNCTLDGLRAQDHNEGPYIVKADLSKTVETVTLTNIFATSTADGSGDYYGICYVQNFAATSKLKNVTISNVTLKEVYAYVANVNSGPTDGLQNIKLSNFNFDLSLSNKTQYVLIGNSTCNGVVQLSDMVGVGAATYGINDSTSAFTQLYKNNCVFDKPDQGTIQFANESIGTTFSKASVAHNTSTQLFSYTYTSPSFASFDVNIGINGASTVGMAKFSIMNGFSVGNASQIHKQGFGLTEIALSLSINTGTKVVTVSVTQTNSSSDTCTVYASVLPRLVGGKTTITPL